MGDDKDRFSLVGDEVERDLFGNPVSSIPIDLSSILGYDALTFDRGRSLNGSGSYEGIKPRHRAVDDVIGSYLFRNLPGQRHLFNPEYVVSVQTNLRDLYN